LPCLIHIHAIRQRILQLNPRLDRVQEARGNDIRARRGDDGADVDLGRDYDWNAEGDGLGDEGGCCGGCVSWEEG